MRQMTLPPQCGIESLPELHASLRAALEGGKSVALDVCGASGVGFALLQLLCSAHRSFAGAGLALVVRGDAAWEEALERSGMRRHRSCPRSPQGRDCLWCGATEEESHGRF